MATYSLNRIFVAMDYRKSSVPMEKVFIYKRSRTSTIRVQVGYINGNEFTLDTDGSKCIIDSLEMIELNDFINALI